MTLLMMEGFDHFTSDAHLIDKNWVVTPTSYITVTGNYGRFGGNGVLITNSGPATYISKDIGSSESTIYFGVACKMLIPGPTINVSESGFVSFFDESDLEQIRLYVNPNYGIAAYHEDNTLLGSTSDFIITNQKWFYLEGKITISATVGEVTLRVNETQVLNLTSQDTKGNGDYIRYIRFSGFCYDRDTAFDDIYVDDAQFHGDCRIKVFVPDSISTTNNSFTASAGNKDECVDDNPPTDDTDYIYSDTLNHKQGFGITTGTLGTVIGIQLNNFTRIDQAGTRKITALCRSNSTDYSGTETEEITADYKFEQEIWEDDPDDSNPWTQTKLEAAEFGLEITT